MKTKILSLILLLSLLLAAVGCTASGKDGKSAYELACEAGFVGTQEEWLASLVGRDGTSSQTTVVVDGEGDALGSLRYAAAVAMRSSVSVICGSSVGSGVIYRLDKTTGEAYIITNHHVVYDEDEQTLISELTVCTYGAEYSEYSIAATCIGASMYYDIAVLYVGPNEWLRDPFFAPVTLASGLPDVGQSTLAIGNADGKGLSVTSGVVSVVSEYNTMTAVDDKTSVKYRVMRTDTPLNSGNSGGGLFDGHGNLLGIVHAKSVKVAVDDIGYVIPVSLAVAAAENILANCDGVENTHLRRAILGIYILASEHRAVYDEASGLLSLVEINSVTSVDPGSTADGYLQQGDRLLTIKVDDRAEVEVAQQYFLTDELLYARAGSRVCFRILRGDSEMTVEIPITAESLQDH